jgi:hypothetical protein
MEPLEVARIESSSSVSMNGDLMGNGWTGDLQLILARPQIRVFIPDVSH